MANLVSITDSAGRDRVDWAALAAAGWHVVEGIPAAAGSARGVPELVILALADVCAAARAVREEAGFAAIPVLACPPAPVADASLRAAGIDACLPAPCAPEALVAAAAAWRSGAVMAGAERLAALFGRTALGRLLAGLRDQLAAAIGDDAGVVDAGAAHRIAGLAGTLGFAAVSASWLAVSEGDDSLRGLAWRDARRAIAAIDADTQNTQAV